MLQLAQVCQRLADVVGRALSWLVLLLALIVVYDVAMRFLFRAGSVGIQEFEWHLFALIFLLGAAYTYQQEGHVRVEVLRHRWSQRTSEWVDILGDLFLLLPMCVIVIQASLPFIVDAYSMGESSPDPGGLPHRFLIKAAIPTGFVLLAVQAVANVIFRLHRIFKSDEGGNS